MNGGDCWTATANALSHMPDVVVALLAEHVDDGNGRCTSCTQAGTGLRRTPWPCPTRRMAATARALHARRRGAAQLYGGSG